MSKFGATTVGIAGFIKWATDQINSIIAKLVVTKRAQLTSTSLPAAGTTVTLAHGLSAVPTLISIRLTCKTAELGYSVGDTVYVSPISGDTPGTATGYGLGARVDSTNVYILNGSGGLPILQKSTGTLAAAATPANWQLDVFAFV
jgi:hypothetical protein